MIGAIIQVKKHRYMMDTWTEAIVRIVGAGNSFFAAAIMGFLQNQNISKTST